jgi:uncharacterized protein (TIGR02599 family)
MRTLFLSKILQPAQGPRRRSSKAAAFTLVELLLALSIITILLLVGFQIIARTSALWVSTNSKLEQFREARIGFSALTARLSQATLNQYSGYEYTDPTQADLVPRKIGRRSELRFLSGPAARIAQSDASSPPCPTQAIFFVAPLGLTSTNSYARLQGLLNICGYFVQWSNIDPERPAILPGSDIYRFRLMQFIQPAEAMGLYSKTSTSQPTYQFVPAPGWQLSAMQQSPAALRALANNVVGLFFLPTRSTSDLSGTLAPDFIYDTESENPDPALSQRNRLPPVVRVILYTIDEASARKLSNTAAMPDLYTTEEDGLLFRDPDRFYPAVDGSDAGDLARFEEILRSRNLVYRRHEAAIELLPQPWNLK